MKIFSDACSNSPYFLGARRSSDHVAELLSPAAIAPSVAVPQLAAIPLSVAVPQSTAVPPPVVAPLSATIPISSDLRHLLEQFRQDYLYFERYRDGRIFQRRWWYAFGSSALYFFSTLGMIIEIVSASIHYLSYSVIVNPISMLFSMITGVLPLSIVLVAVSVFAVFSLVLSYEHFVQTSDKCKNACEQEQDVLNVLCENIYLRYVYQLRGLKLPESIDRTIDLPVAVKKYRTFFSMLKFIISTSFFNILGTIGWLHTFSAFIGGNFFSTVAFTAGLPFLSPLFISGIFIFLTLGASLWIEAIVKVKYDYHSAKQSWSKSEIDRQNGLLRDVAVGSLGEDWHSPNNIFATKSKHEVLSDIRIRILEGYRVGGATEPNGYTDQIVRQGVSCLVRLMRAASQDNLTSTDSPTHRPRPS